MTSPPPVEATVPSATWSEIFALDGKDCIPPWRRYRLEVRESNPPHSVASHPHLPDWSGSQPPIIRAGLRFPVSDSVNAPVAVLGPPDSKDCRRTRGR